MSTRDECRAWELCITDRCWKVPAVRIYGYLDGCGRHQTWVKSIMGGPILCSSPIRTIGRETVDMPPSDDMLLKECNCMMCYEQLAVRLESRRVMDDSQPHAVEKCESPWMSWNGDAWTWAVKHAGSYGSENTLPAAARDAGESVDDSSGIFEIDYG